MIDFKFPKSREIRVLEQAFTHETAEQKANESKEGVIGGFARALSHKESGWEISDYFIRYEPFWHIKGESFFEYIRRAQYKIEVKPEVRSVKINKVVMDIDEHAPFCTLDGNEHCFEEYSEEALVAARKNGKGTDALKPYLEAKSKKIKSINMLVKAHTDVAPIETRASFIVTDMTKKLLKSVQADKVIREKIAIKNIVLYFRPIHVFNYKQKESGKQKTVEVDAITGEVHKPSMLVQKIRASISPEATLFDIGGGIADSVIPGAGIGAFIGKSIVKYKRNKKIKRAMESSKSAARGKIT